MVICTGLSAAVETDVLGLWTPSTANALIGNKQKDGSYKPAVYFFNTCIHAIRTIPMLAHDKHNPETYDTDGEDHVCDAACYAMLSRPWAPTKPEVQKPRDKYAHKEAPSVWAV